MPELCQILFWYIMISFNIGMIYLVLEDEGNPGP